MKQCYRLQLGVSAFPQDSFVCLGRQLYWIVQHLVQDDEAILWYGADIEATTNLPDCLQWYDPNIGVIGTTAHFLGALEVVDQFLSGVFLAYPSEAIVRIHQRVFVTDDAIDRGFDPAIIEIRTFDTSYVEIYAYHEVRLSRLAVACNIHPIRIPLP